ncbi:hypothetical protein GOP47_0004503 [Adiantum capillus-veneris]|uniref:acid phosphatase n=1 Tax=Adiantum capillus-veneris TaxID=13818 RepID=A0A9D4V8D1_ADICA|nr:hypothetical protein GOP47_0004503 [Adiantum capillus-veneris]
MALRSPGLPLPLKPTSKCPWQFFAAASSIVSSAFLPARKAFLLQKRTETPVISRPSGSLIVAAMADASSRGEDHQIGVLFVCLGNICRSPTAEAVFRYLVEKRELESQFCIDSAGTIDYHEGEPADARMKAAASKRGVKLMSISRPIRPSDFEEFDIILAMDRKNKEDILKAHRHWSTTQALPPSSEKKVKLMCEYCKKFDVTEVPDPYYGGAAGFEKVLDLLEDACESLLDSLVSSTSSKKLSG